MRFGRAILWTGLMSLALSAAAWAQSRPADTQPTTSATVTTRPAVPDVPITFGRSGRKVLVWLTAPKGVVVEKVVLRAFGRAWTAPVAAQPVSVRPGYTAEIDIPAVRVPTVFSVAPADSPDIELGQLIAYPDRDVEWDKKITLYSCGAPEWFRQWAVAAGLPVGRMNPGDLASAKLAPADEKGKSLLILGRDAAGKDLSDATKLADDKKVNVLVLDADWFGEAAGPVSVAPAQMLGGLAPIAKQVWPQPLRFAFHRKPWPGIANRWAWVVDADGLPVVEEVAAFGAPLDAMRPVLASYLPWADLLGRRDIADATFQQVLIEASNASVTNIGWRRIDLVHPKQDKLDKKDRPVLWAAANTGLAWKDLPRSVRVVDLRGSDPLPENLLEQLRAQERQIGYDADRLLILGDDRLLDEWEWLKLDRTKKTINRPGVVWLSDDELPPLRDSQIRLMLKLTELGVPLAPPKSEEKNQ